MYRWTDPIEPDGSARHPQPPAASGPAWLTDRPEPRSAYLFGDEPEAADAGWAGTATEAWRTGDPDGGWRTGTSDDTWRTGDPGDAWRTDAPEGGWRADGPDDRWQPGGHPDWTAEHAAFEPAVAPFEQSAGWPAQEPSTWRPATDGSFDEPGRHRQSRRFPRPLLIGGAAAAATLVATLGVAGLLLPGDGQQTGSSVADDAAAAAPVAPDASGDTLARTSPTASPTGSPSAAPSSARPSPTRTATPQSNRTTASSRQLQRTAAPSSTTARTTSASGLSAELQQVVDLVNAERAKAGCKAVTVNDKLTLAAQRHSQDQADHKTMTHDGSDGSNVGERLDRVGYAWRAYGENVAWNQQSPAAVMDAWMNSSGHRANILNCSFTQIGVGVARSNGPYWTQDFGTPR
ncbi:CAP domain-containing protein [Micromonospora sp. NPDC093277]|uniref:CAP domain-containing protein n=1 Tax=Micromonospora sp. NPDC093277 TaxID=3364291 RepID=UPI00382B1DE4